MPLSVEQEPSSSRLAVLTAHERGAHQVLRGQVPQSTFLGVAGKRVTQIVVREARAGVLHTALDVRFWGHLWGAEGKVSTQRPLK